MGQANLTKLYVWSYSWFRGLALSLELDLYLSLGAKYFIYHGNKSKVYVNYDRK